MDNGYYELFLQTGSPAFYVLAKQAEEQAQKSAPPTAG